MEKKKFILTDAIANNNKFWNYSHDGVNIHYEWGRVGSSPQKKTMAYSERDLNKRIREKTGKGYVEVAVLESVPIPAVNGSVKEAAFSQLAGGDTTLQNLIERLVAANRHELLAASGGKIDINLSTGAVTTALGIVTKESIQTAREHLAEMSDYIEKSDFDASYFVKNLNSYLMLVPQQVGHYRGWHRDFLTSEADVLKQASLLDQLEASADFALSSATAQLGSIDTPKLFETSIHRIDDSGQIKMVEDFFDSTRNASHTSNSLKVAKLYGVDHGPMKNAYVKDGANLPNRKTLWHGTRTFNVLSILKSGLIVPKSTGSFHITGRMFGDGLYFSDQSTKSLNYAQGYWGGGGTKDDNCFMFLAEVAMGNEHTPSSRVSTVPIGYDSLNIRGGTCGVMNNEMIVFRTSQVDLRFLVEFERR